jgi:prevent-host-death family protein
MTRTWKLEDAKAHLSQLIRDAETEPQVITRHGKPVVVVSPVSPAVAAQGAEAQPKPTLPALTQPTSALEALRGEFDFSDFPDEDLFARDTSSDLRDLKL